MGARRLAANVLVRVEGGLVVTLHAGDSVPEDVAAYITNPACWADDEPAAEAAPAEPAQAPKAPSYAGLKKPQLIRIARGRGLSIEGTTAVLRERLEADDSK